MSQYEAFGQAVDALVGLAEAQGPHSMSGDMDSVTFAMEFRTVSVGASRRSGKTEYIKRRLRPGLDVCLVASARMRDALFEDRRDIIVADSTIVRQLQERHAIERVYVDEPSLVFRTFSARAIYGALMSHKPKLFIHLGTAL